MSIASRKNGISSEYLSASLFGTEFVAPSRRHFRQIDFTKQITGHVKLRKVNAFRLVHALKGTNEKYAFKEDYMSTTYLWSRGFVGSVPLDGCLSQ